VSAAKPQRWIMRPEIIDYIIESYAGIERDGRPRRVFIWEEGAEVYMGNCEAFLQHLAKRFELVVTLSATSQIHELLRELGEQVLSSATDRAPRSPTPVGRFKQPEPEQWLLPRRPTPSPNDPD
jgi:hypothetical protein